jgi:sugar lactone lactonase YvrE
MAFDALVTASLKRVDPDGTVTVAADGLSFPNGAVVSDDGSTLIVGETLGNRYTAFTIDSDGTLRDRRVWAQLGPDVTLGPAIDTLEQLRVATDGCTLDAQQHIWPRTGSAAAVHASRSAGTSLMRFERRRVSVSSRACSEATTVARCCSAARRTISRPTAATPARPSCSPHASTCPTRAALNGLGCGARLP